MFLIHLADQFSRRRRYSCRWCVCLSSNEQASADAMPLYAVCASLAPSIGRSVLTPLSLCPQWVRRFLLQLADKSSCRRRCAYSKCVAFSFNQQAGTHTFAAMPAVCASLVSSIGRPGLTPLTMFLQSVCLFLHQSADQCSRRRRHRRRRRVCRLCVTFSFIKLISVHAVGLYL